LVWNKGKRRQLCIFIVWANFISSLLYLFAAYGLIKLKRWSYQLLGASALILIIALIGLFIHINNGGLHETKTIGAMFFRTSLTLVFTVASYFIIKKSNT
jgi:heme/copper-type cytochrome/quinol oxidase subunit 4